MRNNKTSQLEKLKEQQSKLTARIQATEARIKVSERKQETRRKILVGSYYIDDARKNNNWDSIKKLMDNYLTRISDRTLFELPTEKKESNLEHP